MRFPPHFLDELRARLPVSEVCGKRVRLKKQGREWAGLSPFNKERTPSFFVNDQKGFWHDFSSGRNGDIFGFVMETEGVTFPEAVERLAAQAGMALPKVTPEAEAVERRRKTLHEVVGLAAEFFEATLTGKQGGSARAYIAERGISATLQSQFRVGYAPPERFTLKEHLGAQGVGVNDMIEAGLLVSGENIPVPYDRFRDRVMFPIADLVGRIVAFGGRALDPDASAKYLNSPETPLFHKGSLLYNGGPARKAAHLGAKVVVVEGYIDVIAMVSAGYEAAVAPLGTALTDGQIALMWKMADEPVLCFDGDGAGHRAASKAVDLALPALEPGKSLLFASLPLGRDPDDIVRSGGREAITTIIDGARPLADVLWARESGKSDTPERRSALESRIKELVGSIGNESVRRNYRDDFFRRLKVIPFPRAPRAGWRRRPALVVGETMGALAAAPTREALMVQAMLEHPWLVEENAEALSAIDFTNPDADAVRKCVLDITADGLDCTFEAFQEQKIPKLLRAALIERGHGSALRRLDDAAANLAGPDTDPEFVRRWWAQVMIIHHIDRLSRELQEAMHALGESLTEENFARLQDVKQQIAVLETALR